MQVNGRRAGAALIAACVAAGIARGVPAQLPPIPGFVRCDILVGGAPVSAITEGDFNIDGNPDLALVDGTNSQVLVLITNPSRFRAGDCANATTITNNPVSALPTSIAVGDVDRSNTLDLVVGVQAGASILRGDGTGQFSPEAPLAAGSDPQAVAISDVDRDGLPDIVVGNGAGNSVSILYGRAGGTFDPAVSLSAEGAVTFIVVQDLNQDSFVDIAAGSGSSGKVTVFIQDRNAPRSFPLHPSFTVGVRPTAMVAGDFDGDGAPDLAITSTGVLALFLNQLPENVAVPFVQGTVAAIGGFPSAVGADYFNPDFALDAVVANPTDLTLPFFLGNGQGGLAQSPGNCRGGVGGSCSVGQGPRGLVLADVDGDGSSDVITANQNAGSISVLLSSQPPPTATPTPTVTPTPTPTASPIGTGTSTRTETPTITPTPTTTETNTPRPTLTATSTPTFTPRCFGNVCVEGEGCGNLAPGRTSRNGLWLLAPALLWWMRRHGRRA